jgi:hypothetical protein
MGLLSVVEPHHVFSALTASKNIVATPDPA